MSSRRDEPAPAEPPRAARTLPAGADLRRLRDEAKARKRSGQCASLAEAQFEIAREHGFASWPRLKAHVETRALDERERAAALVRSACSADLRTARTLLAAEPGLARHDLAAACATGEPAEVVRRVERDPHSVRRALPPSGWQALSYACFSRFLRADPDRARGIVAVVRVLLDAGADPNAYWLDGEFRELPLFGAAGIANNAELTRMLLAAGADPNETYEDPERIGEALYHAVEFPDPECARLLVEAGTTRNRVDYCLGRALNFPNHAMIAMLLRHGARPSAGNLMQAVYKRRPAQTVAALLDAGAPVDQPDDDGVTPLRTAVRWGDTQLVELLLARGADPARITDADRVLGAALSEPRAAVSGHGSDKAADTANDRALGETSAAGHAPSTAPRRLTTADERNAAADLLDWAATTGDVATAQALLASGAPVDGRPDRESSPLSQAMWRGHARLAALLLEHGASTQWPDGGTALGAALHGAAHCHDPEGGPTMRTADEVGHGDYAGAIRLMLARGQRPTPRQLGDPELDVVGVLDRLGIDLAEAGIEPPAHGASSSGPPETSRAM